MLLPTQRHVLHTLAMFVTTFGYLSIPLMQVLHNSLHDGGATHAAITTDTTPADLICLYLSERCNLVYVSVAAIPVA